MGQSDSLTRCGLQSVPICVFPYQTRLCFLERGRPVPCHRVVYRGIGTGVASNLLASSLNPSSIRADVVGGGAEHRGGGPGQQQQAPPPYTQRDHYYDPSRAATAAWHLFTATGKHVCPRWLELTVYSSGGGLLCDVSRAEIVILFSGPQTPHPEAVPFCRKLGQPGPVAAVHVSTHISHRLPLWRPFSLQDACGM